jgi:hypothetical protein
MTERLTKRDLHDLKKESFHRQVAVLAAEVRRQRGIIASLDVPGLPWLPDPDCCGCIFCEKPYTERHEPDCPWPAFKAEADAIAAEEK